MAGCKWRSPANFKLVRGMERADVLAFIQGCTERNCCPQQLELCEIPPENVVLNSDINFMSLFQTRY